MSFSGLLRFFVMAAFLWGLTASAGGQEMPPRKTVMPDDYVPEEYSVDEFPQWLWDLRRFEVIAIGSFPVTFFATSFIYDYSVYGAHRFDPAYALGTQRSNKDIAIIAGTAAGLSVIVATIDLIVELVQRSKREKEDEKSKLSGSAP